MNDARMKLWERRKLSDGEVALGRGVFGDEIDWTRVSLRQIPKFGFGAMAPSRGTILFSHWRAARDFAFASMREQGWFIHELAHVWQASQGVLLIGAKIGALGKRAYRYEAAPEAKWRDFNIERQAEIARHLFLARAGAGEPGAPSLDWLEAVWATRFTGAGQPT